MPRLPLSVMSDDRRDYGMPVARLENMYVEKVPEGETADGRFPRPGLTNIYTIGTGPTRGMFQQDNLFNGDVFVVSGTTLYRWDTTSAPTALGTIAGIGQARFSGTVGAVAVVSNGIFYVYDGTTLTAITAFTGGDPVPQFSDVAYLSQRFVLSVYLTTTIYWTGIDDFKVIDPLGYANADTDPGFIVGLKTLGDDLGIYKQESVEWWTTTSDSNAPYTRSLGRNYTKGCAAMGTIVTIDNQHLFVGNDRIVYRGGVVPTRVSIHGVEERLRNSGVNSFSGWLAWRLAFNGHLFYVLCIPDQGTFVYDLSTSLWAEWTTYGFSSFLGAFAITRNDLYVIVGNQQNGVMYTIDETNSTDDGQPLVCVISAFIPPAVQMRLSNISLSCVVGLGTPSVPRPKLQMRISVDGNNEWGPWQDEELGPIGNYLQRPVWWRQGIVGNFGAGVEWRCAAPVKFVAKGASYNDRRPG